MSNPAPSLSRLQLPPTQHTSPNTLVHTFLTQENLSYRSHGVRIYSLGDVELKFGAQLIFMSRSRTTTHSHAAVKRSHVLLSNSDQLTNTASLLHSLTLSLHPIPLTHKYTFAQKVLHLIHLGREKQALPTAIRVSMATANQVMSLYRPASTIQYQETRSTA